MSYEFKILGLDKIKLALKVVDKKFRDEVEKSAEVCAEMVQVRAHDNLWGTNAPTPNRHWITGNLGRSVKGEVQWISTNVIVGVIGTGVHYAPYIEAMPDGGFLKPALMTEYPKVMKKLQDDLVVMLRNNQTGQQR